MLFIGIFRKMTNLRGGDYMKKDKKVKNMKKVRRSGVRNRLISIITISIVLPLILLGYFSYKKSFNILDDKLSLTSQQIVGEMNRSLTSYLGGIEHQTKSLSDNSIFSELSNALYNGSNNQVELERVKVITEEILKNTKESNPDMLITFFATTEGDFFLYPYEKLEGFDPRVRPWYGNAIKTPDMVTWTDPYISEDKNKETTITASKAVVVDGKVIGVVGVDINLKALAKDFAERVIGREGYAFVTDRNGIMIAHNDATLIGTDAPTKQSFWEKVKSNEKGFDRYTYNGANKFLSFETNKKTGWKIMASLDENELLADTKAVRNFTFYMIIFGAILALIVSALIALFISKPLSKLKESFAKAAEGDLTAKVDMNRKDEFGEIGQAYNMMLDNIGVLFKNVREDSVTVLSSSMALTKITEQTASATNEVARAIEEIAKCK